VALAGLYRRPSQPLRERGGWEGGREGERERERERERKARKEKAEGEIRGRVRKYPKPGESPLAKSELL
jgi:hypothetical protein